MTRKHRAFSLVEALTGLLITALIIGAMTMKPGSSRQSIRREAERIAAYIQGLMQFADKTQKTFNLSFEGGSFVVHWSPALSEPEKAKLVGGGAKQPFLFAINKKYKLYSNRDPFMYLARNNSFAQGGTITVREITDEDIRDKKEYYIIIATIGGRVRTSPDPPDNWHRNNGKDYDDTY